jgi:HD-GYP domain-containing protein (c-di-GMP phosphodiesterase class II)
VSSENGQDAATDLKVRLERVEREAAGRQRAAYGVALARACGLDVGANPQVEFGFLLHDVGKVAVPDAILFKPTDEEFALVARHPVVGAEILQDVSFLGEAKLIVRHHHERWDGTGYPDGFGATTSRWPPASSRWSTRSMRSPPTGRTARPRDGRRRAR